MEINEKLNIFYNAAIEAASAQSREILEKQEEFCTQRRTVYEEKKQEEWQHRQHAIETKVRREVNRSYSKRLLEQKKAVQRQQEEYTQQLFLLAEQKLRTFCATAEYKEFLIKKIENVKAFADGAETVIYLNRTDEGLLEELAARTGCSFAISGEDFLGGIRAVVRGKNVRIDESFTSGLAQLRSSYTF